MLKLHQKIHEIKCLRADLQAFISYFSLDLSLFHLKGLSD